MWQEQEKQQQKVVIIIIIKRKIEQVIFDFSYIITYILISQVITVSANVRLIVIVYLRGYGKPWGETIKTTDNNSRVIVSGSPFVDQPKKIPESKLIVDNKLSVANRTTDDSENEEPEIADYPKMKRFVKRNSFALESPTSSPLQRKKLVIDESLAKKRKQL